MTIEFVKARQPIVEPVTKFGGQPVWLNAPQWPLSRKTGKPMRFICQIKLLPQLFANARGKLAYLFITDDDEYVDGTWEPDGGENAVIIQPHGKISVTTVTVATGPTLYQMVEQEGYDRLQPESVEFGVSLVGGTDPEFIPEDERWKIPDEEQIEKIGKIDENKIGGTPVFLQNDEIPGKGWMLLIQLDSCNVPFSINFGDAGVGYGFLSESADEGKFLWQCA